MLWRKKDSTSAPKSEKLAARDTEKYRHPVLTVLLSIMLTLNIVLALSYPSIIKHANITHEHFALANFVGILILVNVICLFAIVFWKRWGFYGFLISSLLSCLINYHLSHNFSNSLEALVSVIFLYIALQFGGKRRGWYKLH